jgi:hypothetical protein
VPALNLLLGIPLKLAVGTSGLILSVVDTSAAWVYIHRGAVLPVLVAPSIVGVMLGAKVGAQLLRIAPSAHRAKNRHRPAAGRRRARTDERPRNMELNPDGGARRELLAPIELTYARWLDWGTRIGLALLIASFLAYALEIVAPHVPFDDLARSWVLPVDEYRLAVNAPAGWAGSISPRAATT